ncbi:MAG TPA: hypothetical protein VF384_18680 [Planctomycetota bacterium]
MHSFATLLTLFTLSTLPLAAQAKLMPFGGTGQRNNTVVGLADTSSGFKLMALVSITYGVPEWKPEYADKAEELTKGRMFRLGRDNWAIFDTTCPVKFGNVTVPAGLYYLGVSRSKDGAVWNLVFLDPAKTKASGATPPAPEAAPHAFDVRLVHERIEGEVTETLAVTMAGERDKPTHGTLTIAWGDRKLTGSYDLVIDAR